MGVGVKETIKHDLLSHGPHKRMSQADAIYPGLIKPVNIVDLNTG